MQEYQSHRFCVAPIMDGTDRHCRYFHRLLTKRARLYSEMIVAEAIVRGDRARLLAFDAVEHPVALQLGGSDPEVLGEAARIGADFGYDEINLNVGCPSDRVQSGAFGACLMKTPDLVADCYAAMQEGVLVPVSVKCRIGVDDQDPEESLFGFVDRLAKAGCNIFAVHARKAWLDGLSPKDNREIPPLDYGLVCRLKKTYPQLTIVLNGGITSIEQSASLLADFDGVMLGRVAYGRPAILAEVDQKLFGAADPGPDLIETAKVMSSYVKQMTAQGVAPHHIVQHMLGLFHGESGARAWRRALSQQGAATPATIIDQALAAVTSAATA